MVGMSNQEHVQREHLELVSTQICPTGEVLSTESSRTKSISLIGSWLSKYSNSLRLDSASKGRSSFLGGNVIRASSSTNSSRKIVQTQKSETKVKNEVYYHLKDYEKEEEEMKDYYFPVEMNHLRDKLRILPN
ncbi:hypothetical protein Tco_0889073 [Tanacetum coccineum]